MHDRRTIEAWRNDKNTGTPDSRRSGQIKTNIVYAAVAEKLIGLDGVRRALIAYWNEAFIGLKELNMLSTYARHHNWNAIAWINSLMRQEGL